VSQEVQKQPLALSERVRSSWGCLSSKHSFKQKTRSSFSVRDRDTKTLLFQGALFRRDANVCPVPSSRGPFALYKTSKENVVLECASHWFDSDVFGLRL